jgi:uncharacterized protein
VLELSKKLIKDKTMTQSNLFQNRKMIKNREDFFGRKKEIQNILIKLENNQSCSIVGERRIGKSSLLWYISQTGFEKLNNPCSLFYHDLQNARYHTVLGFCRTILKDLKVLTDSIKEDKSSGDNLIALSDEMKKLSETGRKMVFCFDEFESLFKHPTEFTDDFFEHFRSEINAASFTLLTVSKNSLQNLCLAGQLTSPFYNVFEVTELEEFKKDEAKDFLEFYLNKAILNEKDLEFIEDGHKIHKWHPLKLQIICDCLLQNRKEKLNKKELLKKIDGTFGNYFVGTFDLKNWRRSKKFFSLEKIKTFLEILKSGREIFKGK